MSGWAATVGADVVSVAEVDARERAVRAHDRRDALPQPGTSEGRQLRRWLTQVLVAERVVAATPGSGAAVPAEVEVLPDTVARLELGSVAAATLATAHGRAVYAEVTAHVEISDDTVADYRRRNPNRFARPADVAAHLLAAARRREYRRWLDARCAELVTLAPGYEHPGDPRQPDNVHRH